MKLKSNLLPSFKKYDLNFQKNKNFIKKPLCTTNQNF